MHIKEANDFTMISILYKCNNILVHHFRSQGYLLILCNTLSKTTLLCASGWLSRLLGLAAGTLLGTLDNFVT